jgi:hypothetical protein
MRRRNFLKIAGAGTAAVAALPAGWYVATSVPEAAAGIITREFSYLKLDPKGVARFVDDYLKDPLSGYTPAKIKAYYALRTGSDASMMVADLTRKYLLSSDYFTNKMDENRTVQYLGFYNPYRSPCANPFSSLHYPDVLS